MAEALARKIAERRGIPDLSVSSAGTNAWDNTPATDEALLVGMEREIDLTGHRARKLTSAIVSEADLIFVMTGGGPANATQITSTYTLLQAYSSLDFGYAGALSVVLLLVMLTFTALYLRVTKGVEETE